MVSLVLLDLSVSNGFKQLAIRCYRGILAYFIIVLILEVLYFNVSWALLISQTMVVYICKLTNKYHCNTVQLLMLQRDCVKRKKEKKSFRDFEQAVKKEPV